MAIQDISRLYSSLNTSKLLSENNALYQTIKGIIDSIIQVKNQEEQNLQQAIADLQKIINQLANQDFATVADDAADLPNSRQLLAGTGITFDDSVPNARTINSSGGGSGGSGSGAVFIPRIEDQFNLLSVPPSINNSQLKRTMNFVITGSGGIPSTGAQGYANRAPVGGIFVKWSMFGFPSSGSAVVDIYKGDYSAFPGSLASICGTDLPTISSAQKNESTALTGWTTGFNAGDIFQPYLNTISTFTAVVVFADYIPR